MVKDVLLTSSPFLGQRYVFAPRMSVSSTNNITDRNDIIKILFRMAALITHSRQIFDVAQPEKKRYIHNCIQNHNKMNGKKYHCQNSSKIKLQFGDKNKQLSL